MTGMDAAHAHVWMKSPTPGKEKCSICGKERIAAANPPSDDTNPFKGN